jgi:hypothetical protein
VVVDQTSVNPCSVLVRDELVGPAQEHLRRHILPPLATQRTLKNDGLKRELLQPGRHIAAAPLAGDHKKLACWRTVKHTGIIGE